MSVIAVISFTAEPLGEKALLPCTLIGKIAPEERPERLVGFDSVIEPCDQRVDHRGTTDTRKNGVTEAARMRLGLSQKSTGLHTLIFSHLRTG